MQFYTTNNVPANLMQRSFGANITRIMPNGGAPLLAMSGYAEKKVALQPNHGFWVKTAVFPQAVINAGAGYTSSDTIFTIDSNSAILPNQVLRHQVAYNGASMQHTTMAEQMLVTAINSDTSITVQRGWAGTTPAAITDNAVLAVVGTAFEQGSESPLSSAIQPVLKDNYTQIFRNAWDITGTLAATALEMGYNSVSENKQDCAWFHATDIERALIFGVKSQTTRNGRPLFTMNGIESIIQAEAPTNLWEAGATTTYTQLESMLNGVFDYTTDRMNGNVRLILCGGTALQVINDIGRLYGTYQLHSGETKFGLKFNQFKTSRGMFDVIEHPLFNTVPDWKKMAITMELSSFDLAYLRGRDTVDQPVGAGSGRDATGGVLTSELTLELRNPFACSIIYNLRAAA